MKTTSEIRSSFLNFFKQNHHEEVPSSSLIPHNDPTLLFTAAGMVQFKDVFTGLETRPYHRAVTAQKCLRAGGKHNDLENVGYTSRHHTFFEMLGNFSFGDYFKEEAIFYAWNFVTKELQIPKNRLLVTVYSEDSEAAALWQKIGGFSDDKIIRISTTDNFWSAGDTGPCGPCSEIFYDHGDTIPGGPPGSKDEDGDRFVEIWNLVFMQYEQKLLDSKTEPQRFPLPRPSIDTGMGLERISAVLQGVQSNYDIDLFQALIQAIVEITGVPYHGKFASSHRVIADHLRASSFLIAEGTLPSNEGRGYVLRRIMRRAMRHVQLLGKKDPLLQQLFPVLLSQMGGVYPELERAKALISETLFLEEVKFQETLERGLKLLQDELSKLPSSKLFPGESAFKLYDTYGFPLDLTEDALRAQGIHVDMDGFKKAMEKQKAEARSSWVGSGEAKTDSLWYALKDKVGATDFLGYETLKAEGVTLGLISQNKEVEKAQKGDTVLILTNQSPFYGESGGQMGDTGTITTLSKVSPARIKITNTLKKLGDLIVHEGFLEEGTLHLKDNLLMQVDKPRRDALRANHSATHLLHSALHHILGSHVAQKGSLVAPDKLRFDFSHPKALTSGEIQEIEFWVNAQIRSNSSVLTHLMSIKDALQSGATALFGEKYAEEVRVVSMGADDQKEKDLKTSVELCGGTHVTRTGDIGYFKIIQETGVAAGIRRIEALTGKNAEIFVRQEEAFLKELCLSFKSTPETLSERIQTLLLEKKRLEKEIQNLRQQAPHSNTMRHEDLKTFGALKVLNLTLKNYPLNELKSLLDAEKHRLTSGLVVLANITDDKVSLIIGVTKDLTPLFNAVELVQKVSPLLGGKGGGGRPDLAQAGGSSSERLKEIFKMIDSEISQKIIS
ncbi:MAG: alanine--tRNA ligase [Proteobacteria bacterium]|nr:alanine--tRNA ligase [Pseudomonadota bacterium]